MRSKTGVFADSAWRMSSAPSKTWDRRRTGGFSIPSPSTSRMPSWASCGQRVHPGYSNQGRDIIERSHHQIIRAVLNPGCADGRAFRVAFVPRVELRIKDAILEEKSEAWKPGDPPVRRRKAVNEVESESPASRGEAPVTSYNPSSTIAESLDVEDVLQRIPDGRKRLAFRLFMDDIPYKSKKTRSIAKALGIEDKTARMGQGSAGSSVEDAGGPKV